MRVFLFNKKVLVTLSERYIKLKTFSNASTFWLMALLSLLEVCAFGDGNSDSAFICFIIILR